MTATFEFVCETFVITYKWEICSDSNKYIVSYGWHWNQWIWRSSSRCECVDQLCQLGCLASCVLAHLVVQNTFYLFSKYILSPLSFPNIFYLFCWPGCSIYILSWHFRVSQFFLVLPSLRPCSSRRRDWSSNVTCQNVYILNNCFNTLNNQARDSYLKALTKFFVGIIIIIF